MTQRTEEFTKELSKPFSNSENAATEFGKGFKNIFDSHLQIKNHNLTTKSADYQLKIVRSSFMTRWFWRLKLNKAQKRLAKCERLFHQGLI
jgi:hypothetical protein